MHKNPNDPQNNIADRLDLLAPEVTPTVQMARARFDQKIAAKEQNMWQKIFQRKYRPVWAGLAVVAVLVVSLSFPQVRAVATSFLGLFRVEQIEAVEVGISLADLSTEMENQFVALDSLLADEVRVEESGEVVIAADYAEAEKLAGYALRAPAQLLEQEQRIVFQPATSVSLTIDQPRWQALIDSMDLGDEFNVPEIADGAEIRFNLPNTVVTGFGDCQVNTAHDLEDAGLPGNCTVLMQSQQPTIEAPPGLDVNQAGKTLLQFLGMSPADAEAFSNRVDWATTLVVPVPQGAKYRNVMVDGVDGVLLEDAYAGGNARFTLLWVKDGMFYALTGDGARYSAISIANSME